MGRKSTDYIQSVIDAIKEFQYGELLTDKELSIQAGLSESLISKIKKKTTTPSLTTLKKLKKAGVIIPKIIFKQIEEIENHKPKTITDINTSIEGEEKK